MPACLAASGHFLLQLVDTASFFVDRVSIRLNAYLLVIKQVGVLYFALFSLVNRLFCKG